MFGEYVEFVVEYVCSNGVELIRRVGEVKCVWEVYLVEGEMVVRNWEWLILKKMFGVMAD